MLVMLDNRVYINYIIILGGVNNGFHRYKLNKHIIASRRALPGETRVLGDDWNHQLEFGRYHPSRVRSPGGNRA